jgi:UDP-N-acetylmuramate dehydrogenase
MNGRPADIESALRQIDLRFERDASLARNTTYGIGGRGDLAIWPRTPQALAQTMALLESLGLVVTILGGGSNVLISDRGVRGVTVLTAALDRLQIDHQTQRLICGAGRTSHEVAEAALAANLAGAAFLAWLPGSIGGACYMNAKAYGGEICEILSAARSVTRGGELIVADYTPSDFAYKDSPFQRERSIVAEITFQLAPGDPVAIKATMDEIERQRRGKHEMDFPSCGCVFKNDYRIGISSGTLIDRCGLRRYRVGDAEVSPYHANFVVNHGQASASEVMAVVRHVHTEVLRQTGHDLALEVQLLGEWD